ncbi:hypothetical protein HNQ07_001115 [Deinococcus metalli]|uniref:Lipoprotein n=1 Tax=Deinococcus metalli TaxID=1141878 RepID=A0A7W8KDD5_9DEIO|nr:hypothetical protein [Deinococcus metalli]MBB5375658.1 hypothetical protein [Deinococcus metalli]GHF38013.1 hypothetical protein GCM10017781_13430 [Deinococcus metalli]
MRVSVPLRPAHRHILRPRAAGLIALVAVSLLCGCSQSDVNAPEPAAAASTVAAAPATTPPAEAAVKPLSITSSTTALTLTHWTATTLPVTVTGGNGGPISLRAERADGRDGDVIEVSPATFTPGKAPTAVTLRPTKVVFPQPDGAAPWKLVASRGGQDLASLDLSVTLNTVNLRFTMEPVTAAAGQTVDAVLTVDADSRDLPGFTFSLSPYIPDEAEYYGPVADATGPRTYTVTSLPATIRVPITFKTFPGDPAAGPAIFQLSVDGLADALGSNRYLGKYVRATVTWTPAP